MLEGVKNYNHYLIEDQDKNIIAWAVDFEKENEILFSIIVSSNYKGKGLGNLLIKQLKSENNEFYGWVIEHNTDLKQNGQVYTTSMPFYLKHDFKILSDIRIKTELI